MDVQPSFVVVVVVELDIASAEDVVDCLDRLEVFDFDILDVAAEVTADKIEVELVEDIVLGGQIYRFDMGNSSCCIILRV